MSVLEKKFDRWFAKTTNNVNLIFVGLGGAGQLAINASRLGVGSITLIDPKTGYSDTNMVTQEVSAFAFKKPKALVIAREIEELFKFSNPSGRVEAHVARIQEVNVESTIRSGMHNIAILSADNPEAQLCGYRMVWDHELDSIVSASYKRGLGGEVSFTIGRETPCHYCVSPGRMEAAQKGEKVGIDSFGGTVFSASFLNAIVGQFLLAQIFRLCPDMPEYYGVLDRWKNRNLGFVSMHPESERLLGVSNDTPLSPFGIQMWDEDIYRQKGCPVCSDSSQLSSGHHSNEPNPARVLQAVLSSMDAPWIASVF